MADETLLLLRNIRRPGYAGTREAYCRHGGYTAWKRVLQAGDAEAVIQELKASGLRGRGGAGFPTGVKWSFMPRKSKKPCYLICNADESEPGTFKDHLLMLEDPHMFLEGMAIGCYTLGCHTGYIYIRGESVSAIHRVEGAIEEMYAAGLLGRNIFKSGYSLDLVVHPGAGAYICGEETALLDSLEGKRGQPRFKPPFPAESGFDGCPSTVNNVETLANVPFILNEGAKAFARMGTPNNTGTQLVCVSGHVRRPGVYEVELGRNLISIINDFGGGVRDNKAILGVIPGGASAAILRADEIDIPYDFDHLTQAGSMRGSGAIIVFDEDTRVVDIAERTIRFFNHESCGQCTPCREGTFWLKHMVRSAIAGDANEALRKRMERVSENMIGTTICAFGEAAGAPMRTFVQKYPEAFGGNSGRPTR